MGATCNSHDIIQIRVWARPEYVEDLVFAQSQAAAIHDYYEQYTGIQDPMPKLGMSSMYVCWDIVTESFMFQNMYFI